MSWNNRVVWSEGQFLLPQMFQQQERYLEHVIHYRSLPLSPFFWGFSKYEIDSEALNIGKLVLTEAAGVFADGTPFTAPGHTPLPPPLTILPEHLNQQICLAVPVRTPNSEETSFDNNPESLARFSVHENEIRDANSLGRGAQLLQLSHLRLRLLPEKAVTDAWIG
ncbi:type VI secretion system baseplate subunit TssK, partial [Escherichia coli]